MRSYDEKNNILTNDIIISAEIDKRGNSEINNDKIPDFIVHKPGSMDDNLLIIEVKGRMDIKGIAKDFDTLCLFTNKCNYMHGMFILFGYSLSELKDKLPCIIEKAVGTGGVKTNKFEKIEILCKKSKTSPIETITLNELILSND